MGIVIEFPRKRVAAAPMFADEVRGILLGMPGVSALEGGTVERDLIRRKMRDALPHANARTLDRCTDLMIRMRAIVQEAVPK